MDRHDLEQKIATLKQNEAAHRSAAAEQVTLAERAFGARQALEYMLTQLPAPSSVREFPSAVADSTGGT